MHRPVLENVENLPTDRPFLLVANHSGGLAVAEIFSFVLCYLERVGAERPLAGMAHPFTFAIWPFTSMVRGIGAIPSTYAAAEAALESGVPVLVFPGGDYESTRPIWQAKKVTFGGRQGFLRIARKMQVPIVPMGIRGSHYTTPILLRSPIMAWITVIPRFMGIKQFSLTFLGVAGAILLAVFLAPVLNGWLLAAVILFWLSSPFTYIPFVPWTIRMRIGECIESDDLFADDSDETLDAAYERVVAAVQALVLCEDRQNKKP